MKGLHHSMKEPSDGEPNRYQDYGDEANQDLE